MDGVRRAQRLPARVHERSGRIPTRGRFCFGSVSPWRGGVLQAAPALRLGGTPPGCVSSTCPTRPQNTSPRITTRLLHPAHQSPLDSLCFPVHFLSPSYTFFFSFLVLKASIWHQILPSSSFPAPCLPLLFLIIALCVSTVCRHALSGARWKVRAG